MGGTATEKRAWARQQRVIEQEEQVERAILSNKIVMVLVDKIVNEIVRPGPKPEERECYVMAQELRDIVPELELLVANVLKVDAEE